MKTIPNHIPFRNRVPKTFHVPESRRYPLFSR